METTLVFLGDIVDFIICYPTTGKTKPNSPKICTDALELASLFRRFCVIPSPLNLKP